MLSQELAMNNARWFIETSNVIFSRSANIQMRSFVPPYTNFYERTFIDSVFIANSVLKSQDFEHDLKF